MMFHNTCIFTHNTIKCIIDFHHSTTMNVLRIQKETKYHKKQLSAYHNILYLLQHTAITYIIYITFLTLALLLMQYCIHLYIVYQPILYNTIYQPLMQTKQLNRIIHDHAESIYELKNQPLLVNILHHNNATFLDEVDEQQTIQYLNDSIHTYHKQLDEQIKSDIHYIDPYQLQSNIPLNPVSSSVYTDAYSIQQFHNVCITSANKKQFVLLGESMSTQYIIDGNKLYNKDKIEPGHESEPGNKYHWIPQQYINEYTIVQRAQPDAQWRWINGVTYHQINWDVNPGHIFHQQIWPMYQALHYSHLINTNHSIINNIQINEGCTTYPSEDKTIDKYLGVFTGNWQSINRLLAHISIVSTPQQINMIQIPDTQCSTYNAQTLQSSGICYDTLIVNGVSDMYMKQLSHNKYAIQQLRQLTMNYLHLDNDQQHSSTIRIKPLRVTVYGRHDTNRRRIINIDEIMNALAPYHIVNHISEFGSAGATEQLALYASTDILIAPHGAHMTWSFMLPSNSLVVECFTSDTRESPAFSWIEYMIKHNDVRHIKHIASLNTQSIEHNDRLRIMDGDMTVNVDTLCAQLREYNIQCNAW